MMINPRKIRILYIIPNLEVAGAEQHLINLVSNLDKQRFEVLICCIKKPGRLGELFKERGGNVVCLERRSIYDLRIMTDIHRLIKRNGFDIIHTYLFGFHYLAGIPARLCGTPVVISSRREIAVWKKWHHRFLENLGNRFTNKVIACSEAAREFAVQSENLPEEKILTIYNGVDLEKFSPRPQSACILEEFGFGKEDKIIGMVTKFASVKDHKTLLKAVNEIRKIYPRIKCLLVGDGLLKESVELEVESLKLGNNIIFPGKRDDIARILSIMDVFMLTSLVEGLPNTILEAMACGLPVVATNVGGIPEVVKNGKSGILVEPRDYRAIADAVMRLLENVSLRKEMGRRGREIVERKFGLDRMIEDYENLYLQ